jgi:hypothetical protein
MLLTAGLAMEGDLTAAENAKTGLLRVQPEFSLRWMGANLPPSGEFGERVREALRKVGIPEQ